MCSGQILTSSLVFDAPNSKDLTFLVQVVTTPVLWIAQMDTRVIVGGDHLDVIFLEH